MFSTHSLQQQSLIASSFLISCLAILPNDSQETSGCNCRVYDLQEPIDYGSNCASCYIVSVALGKEFMQKIELLSLLFIY